MGSVDNFLFIRLKRAIMFGENQRDISKRL